MISMRDAIIISSSAYSSAFSYSAYSVARKIASSSASTFCSFMEENQLLLLDAGSVSTDNWSSMCWSKSKSKPCYENKLSSWRIVSICADESSTCHQLSTSSGKEFLVSVSATGVAVYHHMSCLLSVLIAAATANKQAAQKEVASLCDRILMVPLICAILITSRI